MEKNVLEHMELSGSSYQRPYNVALTKDPETVKF